MGIVFTRNYQLHQIQAKRGYECLSSRLPGFVFGTMSKPFLEKQYTKYLGISQPQYHQAIFLAFQPAIENFPYSS